MTDNLESIISSQSKEKYNQREAYFLFKCDIFSKINFKLIKSLLLKIVRWKRKILILHFRDAINRFHCLLHDRPSAPNAIDSLYLEVSDYVGRVPESNSTRGLLTFDVRHVAVLLRFWRIARVYSPGIYHLVFFIWQTRSNIYQS